jgi:phenolic acid decarboxylase
MRELPGNVIRWTFRDGPLPAAFEHEFRDDGTLVWRILDGPMQGGSGEEKRYGAARVSDDVYVVSYLAASGHTLTVVLNVKEKRAHAFASNDKEWMALQGTLDGVQ